MTRQVVAIIGGGFTGGAVAWNLASTPAADGARIVVFEPREKLGTGLAYDTSNPVHRINVPASKMSLDSGRPEHFLEWIEAGNAMAADADAHAPDGQLFPRRRTFGDYVNAHIQPFVDSGRIEHRRESVASITRKTDGWRIQSKTGAVSEADIVVIATSHPAPSAPRALAAILQGHPRFVSDPTVPNAFDPIGADDSVLIVGNGLTSADVIASLIARGHAGSIAAISRRGLRSRGHAAKVQDEHGDFTARPIRSARLLTRRVREAIAEAALFGVSWHAVLDAVRSQAFTIWQNLPLAERRRLVRHLRPFWDVHRFRIAPQVEATVDQAIARGQLTVLAASVAAVAEYDGRIRIALKLARGGGTLTRDFDAVVVTTGPAHGGILDNQPYLAGLKDTGIIHSDPARLGIACDMQSRALDHTDSPVDGLYVAGPLARATFGELMGVTQVARHAHDVAGEVIALVNQRLATPGAASDAA